MALTGLMLFGLICITFTVSNIAPSDPAALAAGPDATRDLAATIRREYGLDRPLPEQFIRYVTDVVQGDLGRSIVSTRPVTQDLARFIAWSFSRSPSTLLGLAIVLLSLFLAVFGPTIAPYPADATGAMNLANRLKPPSSAHWFGTDEMGGDLFSRVIIATRTSLWVGLTIVGIATIVGVPLGIAAGYFGGWVRAVIMRITDVFLSVPCIILALAIVSALGPGILNGVVALPVVWWPGYVRLVEAKALALRYKPFVEPARSVGASHARILALHILPNCASPIIVTASMDMGLAILAAASLGFIGMRPSRRRRNGVP